GAKQLLEDAGVDTPVEVRFLTAADNVRRQDALVLVQNSVEQEDLFTIDDKSSGDWGSELSDSSIYDASMFGWQSTSTAVTESASNFSTGGGNNFGGFSNDRVDELYNELQTETDPARQFALLGEVESMLVGQR